MRTSFFTRFGRYPSAEELSAATGIDSRSVHRYLPESLHSLSLDEPCGDRSQFNWVDTLTDPEADGVDSRLLRDSDKRLLQHLVGDLKYEERLVLRQFYGLDGDRPRNLAEIGHTLDLSRERIRQIKEAALERLRHPSRRGAIDALRDG